MKKDKNKNILEMKIKSPNTNKTLVNIDSETLVIKDPIYQKSNKAIYIAFDKEFSKKNINLNQFLIPKAAYNKNADEICRYSNVFIKNYDDDKEFLSALLEIKYQIDCGNLDYGVDEFISDILKYILSDSVIDKINEMVDDYYDIDLTANKNLKNIDLYASQFCNEHGKAIMGLAIAYKLTIPVVCHYYAVKSDKMAEIARVTHKDEPTIKTFLYRVFASYIPLFSNSFDLYNKLVVTINSHLTSTINSEKIMWNRAVNKKITPTIYIDKLVMSAIVDLIPKAAFKKNIIHLIQVAIPQQIKTMLTAKDACDYCEVTVSSRTDELSGLEKMEANNARISDLDIIISNVNIKEGIKRIKKKYKITISDDEIKYYKKNLHSFVFSELIFQFFAKEFGGIYDLKSISKKDYIQLVIIFKKIMSNMGFIYLHQIMTGNVSSSIKRRRISSKQLKKIEMSHKYRKVMDNYSMGMYPENNSTMEVIAALINTPIDFVDYDNPRYLNQNIVADTDVVTDEYLRFIKMI